MESTAEVARPSDEPSPSKDVRDASRKIFISYAHEDREFASRLADHLRENIVNVWLDETGIEGGQDWMREIDEALRNSNEFVVILSPDSHASEIVQNELIIARYLELPVRPVLHRDCAPWLLIASTQYIDFTVSYDEGFEELMKRPPRPRTSWRRLRILLKKFYRPLLVAIALGLGIWAYIYFFSPSNTSFSVSGGNAAAIVVHVRNQGGKASMLMVSSFKLHFGPINAEPLVPRDPKTLSRITGHSEVDILLTTPNMLTPKMKNEDSYFSKDDITQLLPGAKVMLTAEVKESDDHLHPLSEILPAERIKNFILEAYPHVVPH